MEEIADTFEVYKDDKLVCEGTNWECYKYLMDNQSQSTHYAEKYDGWRMKHKEEK